MQTICFYSQIYWLLSKGSDMDGLKSNPSPVLMSDLLHREPPQVKMTALMNSRPHSFTP